MCRWQPWPQPWRCLWRGFLHRTRTTRLRRTILQFRQTFLTDAITFMFLPSLRCYRTGKPPRKFAFFNKLSY